MTLIELATELSAGKVAYRKSNKVLSNIGKITLKDAIASDWKIVPEMATVTPESLAKAILIAKKDCEGFVSVSDTFWKQLSCLILINEGYVSDE